MRERCRDRQKDKERERERENETDRQIDKLILIRIFDDKDKSMTIIFDNKNI